MLKEIDFLIPDEPYTNTFKNKKSIQIVYEGYKFLLLSIIEKTGEIHSIAGETNDIEDTILSRLAPPEDCINIFISAKEQPLEVAFITNNYSHDPVEDFVEILPNGEEHRIIFPKNGILDFYLDRSKLKYNFESKKIIGTEIYRGPPVTDEKFDETIKLQLKINEEQLKILIDDGAPKKLINRYEKMIDWLKSYKERYKNVPAYKIPFPTLESFDNK